MGCNRRQVWLPQWHLLFSSVYRAPPHSFSCTTNGSTLSCGQSCVRATPAPTFAHMSFSEEFQEEALVTCPKQLGAVQPFSEQFENVVEEHRSSKVHTRSDSRGTFSYSVVCYLCVCAACWSLSETPYSIRLSFFFFFALTTTVCAVQVFFIQLRKFLLEPWSTFTGIHKQIG